MNKYRKVMKPKETLVKEDDEIRVTSAGSVSAYVSRAAKVFNELEKPQVVIKATGNALTKAVTLAEVVKRRFKDLHQITALLSTEIVDEYEPLEEGLDPVTDTRSVPVIEITLSKETLDTTDKGYQPPLDASEVKEFDSDEMLKPRGRGRGKGRGKGTGKGTKGKGKGKSKGKGKGKYDDDDDDDEPKGKGKGKGKGKKGKGKGKYDDDDEYDSPPKGKGKGKGKDKGKGKGKSEYEEPKGKGKKGKGKSSKGKGYDTWDDSYDSYPPLGKSKGKGKGKSGKSSGYDDWGSGWDYNESSYGYGGGYSSKSSSKGKGKSSDKGKGKGKSSKGSSWY